MHFAHLVAPVRCNMWMLANFMRKFMYAQHGAKTDMSWSTHLPVCPPTLALQRVRRTR